MRTKAVLPVAALTALLSVPLPAVPAAASAGPSVVGVTLINGNIQSYRPGLGIATNLDGTPLVAGTTRYDPDGPGPQLIFNDTAAGFLWQGMPPGSRSGEAGHMHIFYLDPPSLYYTPSRYVPTAIADNQTVVGSVAFFETRTSAAWQWTPRNGLSFLPLPDSSWQGSAVGESSDGTVVAGTVYQRIGFRTTSRAAQWTDGALGLLGAAGSWSQATAVSPDGTVVVGTSGASPAGAQAARWIGGQPVAVEAVGTSSTAQFTSADGRVAVGTAAFSPALTELVLWDASGAAHPFAPPAGYSVNHIAAINPTANAVVGSLAFYPDCTPGGPGPICTGTLVPFVWTSTSGFTVLPASGYDDSTAVGVSDDGTKVIGEFGSAVQSPDSPKPEAFVWTPGTGEIPLNTLVRAAGYDYDLFGAVAISGSGNRIIATGLVNPPTVHDTDSVILDISGL